MNKIDENNIFISYKGIQDNTSKEPHIVFPVIIKNNIIINLFFISNIVSDYFYDIHICNKNKSLIETRIIDILYYDKNKLLNKFVSIVLEKTELKKYKPYNHYVECEDFYNKDYRKYYNL